MIQKEIKLSMTDEERKCREEKRAILCKCQPICEGDPNLIGEDFDACLHDCSLKHFGKKLPMCTKI